MDEQYYKKYLKYKQKYINLKMKGGSLTINILPNSDIYDINTVIRAEELAGHNHLVIPMNAYELVDNSNTDILMTTGLVDCVAVMIYNSEHGRYFAHYLKYNDFLEDLSNACQIVPENSNECKANKDVIVDGEHKKVEQSKVCPADSTKIKNTLPTWINDTRTVINVVGSGEIYKVMSRFVQMKSVLTNGQINLYLIYPHEDDIDLLKTALAIEDSKFEELIRKLQKRENKNYYKEYYGMFPNGKIFSGLKSVLEELPDKKLNNFYRSVTINRLTAPITNNRCVTKFSLSLAHYSLHNEEYTTAEKLSRDLFYNEFYKIHSLV